jgi:hypothetical protein
MASLSSRLRAHYQGLYEQAKKGLKRNKNRSLVEDQVQAALAKLLRDKMDPDAMAMQKAAHIIECLTKQPGEDDDDDKPEQLRLDLGGEVYGYVPQRLVKDSVGNIIEEDLAPLSFVLDELARSSANLRRATIWNSRKATKAAHFQRWVAGQMEAGRDILDLTWGNCARETGILLS